MRENSILEKIAFFLLPIGKVGKHFIEEITHLWNHWINNSVIKGVALKTIVIMPGLIPQKPSKTSKANDCLLALYRRVTDCFNGDVLNLLHKGETIQRGLKIITMTKK